MSSIEEYFKEYQLRLAADFTRFRRTRTDSDVKGGDNEQALAEFLRLHVANRYVVTNIQAFDSYGSTSAELDVCVLNDDQPFAPAAGQLVIAEGVDFIVQSKAVLTDGELDRAVANCKTVKALRRRAGDRDMVTCNPEDIPYYIERIPYIVFAFSSKLAFETLMERLPKKLEGIPFELQPDALFVLDRGAILNLREGKGKTHTVNNSRFVGIYGRLTEERTLLEFVNYVHTFVPRFRRLTSPLTNYFPDGQQYRVWGKNQP